jgi:flagellar biosynthesis/type III secretory pathway protein FliH
MNCWRAMPKFVTLGAWLNREEPLLIPAGDEVEAFVPQEPTLVEPSPDDELIADVCARVRRFRAMLDDALDRTLADLLREIAVDVVGRELLLAPADLAAIVRRARDRCAEIPVAVRVHPSQQLLGDFDVPVLPDPLLRSGDVQIELRSGSIDARLGVRIEQMLVRFSG